MKIKDPGQPRTRGLQQQQKTSWQMRQQQKQKRLPDEDEMTSPQELGGQPGQQNAGSGRGKDSLNNFDIDTSGKKKPKI